jgi:protocatechuate 3,4-dioxygenase, alpha subunit
MPELIDTELAAPELAATPGQTIGPFFGYALPYSGDREPVPHGSAGSVRLHGYVYDGEGNGVEDALLEIRQADTSGAVPAVPGSLRRGGAPFTGWGRSSTDADGHYWFSTVKPGPAGPGSAPFFAVAVFARGLLNRLFTRAYLPAGPAVLHADALLASLDAAERRAMMAVREADGSLRFDVYLQGPRETPFLSFPGHLR